MTIHSSPAGNFRRGFTLIELLVVIGVVALLLGILLPNLAEARERARAMQCGANLRTLHSLTTIYLQSNDNFYPLGRNNAGGFVSWDNMLASYDGREDARNTVLMPTSYSQWSGGVGNRQTMGRMTSNKIYLCPSDGDPLRDPAYMVNYYPLTYALNGHNGDRLDPDQNPQSVGGLFTTAYGGGSVRATTIENPCETIEFGSNPGFSNVMGDLNSCTLKSPARFTGRRDYTDTASALPPLGAGMKGLHGGYQDNIAYCDGHVEYTDFRLTVGAKGLAFGATGNATGTPDRSTYLSSPLYWARPLMHYYGYGQWTRSSGD